MGYWWLPFQLKSEIITIELIPEAEKSAKKYFSL